jgi:hypothetical protein
MIEDIKVIDEDIAVDNINVVLNLAEEMKFPVDFMLIPTACAIRQEYIPNYAEIYNQKQYIDQVYKRFSGVLNCIEVYQQLLNNRNSICITGPTPPLPSWRRPISMRPQAGAWPECETSGGFFDSFSSQKYYGIFRTEDYKDVSPDVTLFTTTIAAEIPCVTILCGGGGPIFQSGLYLLMIRLDDHTDIFLGGPTVFVTIEN